MRRDHPTLRHDHGLIKAKRNDAGDDEEDALARDGIGSRGSSRARDRLQDASSGHPLAAGLVDALITNHQDGLLERLELRINEVAKEMAEVT